MMKYYFCGIGGIGMSSIAQFLVLSGHQVCGSDRGFDLNDNLQAKQRLEDLGIKIYPQDGSGVTSDIDFFITSTAVEAQIPDVQKALTTGLQIKKRAQMLAEILHKYTGIAVGGTSGKTTITAMIGHILAVCGKSPTIINGGILNNTYQQNTQPSNFIMGNGKYCVIEADESDGTIELYNPAISIVSNISLDHKPLEELRPLFADFIRRTKIGTVLNFDCLETKALTNIHKNTITFSLNPHSKASLIAENIKPTTEGMQFTVNGTDVKLQVPGQHNIENALAAIGAVQLLGIELKDATNALSSFLGTKRRLEKIGEENNIIIFDDYAHNPEKVAASLKALHQENHALWVIFQPHGFTPTKMMKDGFIESFIKNTTCKDYILFAPIFYQGGTVAKDISSKDLSDALEKNGRNAFYFENRNEIPKFIASKAKAGDRIVVMGARDGTLTNLAQDILIAIGDKK